MTSRLEEEQLRKLVELGPALVAELDLDTLLNRVLETACAVTGAKYAAVGILDPQRSRLERFVTHGLSPEQELAIGDSPRGRGVLGVLIEHPQPLRVEDVGAHPRSFGFPEGHPPMRSFLGVPVMIDGKAWGNLYLTEKDGGDFSEADEQAAVRLSSWAAIGIEHARLLARAGDRQARLEETVKRLEATQAVVAAVGAETDLPRVLELIAERGRVIVEARSVLILLRDGDDLVVASGGARFPIAESTSGRVMLAKRPLLVDDPATQLRVSPAQLGVPGAASALLVPLVYRDEALGVLAAFDGGTGSPGFNASDEQLLVAFAASAATAVATAQTVQAERLRHSLDAAEAERKHWARELHDETLQALGSMKVLASAAVRAGDAVQMARALRQLAEGLEDQIESVHTIISELRPAALDDLGLRPAIEALAERHAAIHGSEMVVELALPDPIERGKRLAPEIETTVYRLTQEALSNVGKHADARKICISVATVANTVELVVADDGHGFDVSDPKAGFGLAGMRERVALAGGRLAIESGDTGTTVRAWLDLGGRRLDQPVLEREAD